MKILILLLVILFPALNAHSDLDHGKAHDMSGTEMKMEKQQTDHDMQQMDHDMSGMKKTGKYDYIRVETPE